MCPTYKPFINVGPGEFIKEELEARKWRQKDLAEVLGITPQHVSRIVNNKVPISIETARLLAKAFGQSAQYWLALDMNYRMRLAEPTEEEEAVAVKSTIFEHMPIKELVKNEWLPNWSGLSELVEYVKAFWNTEEIDFSWMEQQAVPNLRKSEAYDQYNEYYALTWFQMAKQCCSLYAVGQYAKEQLEELASDLHSYTGMEDGVQRFLAKLEQCGVRFFVLRHLQKTYVDGAAFFDDRTPVVVCTMRLDRDDNFWFTVAHEIAHILLHLRKATDFFIDTLDNGETEREQEANELASKMTKATEAAKWMMQYRHYVSERRVRACAEELDVHCSIVVGALQFHNLLGWDKLNHLKRKASDLIPDHYFAEESLDRVLSRA